MQSFERKNINRRYIRLRFGECLFERNAIYGRNFSVAFKDHFKTLLLIKTSKQTVQELFWLLANNLIHIVNVIQK